MSIVPAFFKGGDESFGVFYPMGCVVSVFPGPADVDGAAAALRAAGFKADEVGVARADEALALYREFTEPRGLLTRYEQFLSRHRGDEAYLADDLVDFAKAGHAFVFAYAPGAAATALVADTVRPFGPVVLFEYGRFTITEWH